MGAVLTAKGGRMRRNIATCLGWACYMLSITIFTWDGSRVVGVEGALDQIGFPFNLARLIAFSAGFFLGAFFAQKQWRTDRFGKGVMAVAILVALGGFLFLVSDRISCSLAVVGAGCIGLGSSMLFLLWQHALACQGTRSAGYFLPIGSILGVLMFFAASLFGFFGQPLACSVCSTIVSAGMLWWAGRGASELARSSASKPQIKVLFRDIWRPVLCVSAFGFIWQIVYAVGSNDAALAVVLSNSFVLSQVLASFVLIAAWFKFHDSLHIELVFQLLFPLMATGFLGMPFFGYGYQVVFISLSLFAFGIMSMLMQIVCLQKAESLRIGSTVVLGAFAGFVYSSMTLGFAIGHVLQTREDFGFAYVLVLALVLVYGLSFVFFAIKFHWREPKAASGAHEPQEADGSKDACRSIASEAGLSIRETEVFELIVKGRDLPYIAENLVVSKNTVRTHMKNIYAKLGVHSKQEVIDLLDAWNNGR